MKTKALKLAIKQKKIAMDQIGVQIAALVQQVDQMRRTIDANDAEIAAMQHADLQRVFDLANTSAHCQELRTINATIAKQIDSVHARIEELQAELAQLHGQKQALEKLVARSIKAQETRRTIQENELAHESFLRKNTHHRS